MLRYWTKKPYVSSAADDLRTLSLHVMSRAGFGQSFKFQGHDERQNAAPGELEMDYKESLKMILENCVLIFALGTRNLARPWLPQKLRQLHAACQSFQQHMTKVYENEKISISRGQTRERTFMSSLVRASQSSATDATHGSGLSEKEIYGNSERDSKFGFFFMVLMLTQVLQCSHSTSRDTIPLRIRLRSRSTF